eukprot:9130732-Prorocentrum_lima.AAC.1
MFAATSDTGDVEESTPLDADWAEDKTNPCGTAAAWTTGRDIFAATLDTGVAEEPPAATVDFGADIGSDTSS